MAVDILKQEKVISLRLWVTGYRSYELNVFNDKDPKKDVIKAVIKNNLKESCDSGSTWIITGGQLGVEQWTVEAVVELKEEYPELKVALMLPFADLGGNWQDEKKQRLMELKQKADFCASVSKQPYSSPQQLKNYQRFMLDHTEGALLIYDPDYPGKTKFDYQAIKQRQEKANYTVQLVEMLDLQDAASELNEQRQQQEDDYE